MLNPNFYHLIFVDDLVIVSRASRATARASKLYLAIYNDLTSQFPNLINSTIHLPGWFNSRIDKAIADILGMKIDQYRFKYLGCLISPKRLKTN